MSSSPLSCSDSLPGRLPEVDSDWEIAKAIANGSDSAVDSLVSRYEHDVRRMVGRLTAWGPDVDDLVQDVFIQAWRRAGRYRGDGSLRGWLLQIALNRCRNHHRATQRMWRTLAGLATRLKDLKTDVPYVEDPRWVLLQVALAKLSYSDRELLVLVYMEHMDLQGVAEQLGIRESSLHVRLHRARKRLAKQIQNIDEE